ncbi:MAG: AAA family ATPase [Chloroflexi bacterium]|nr:AAA family ATPase [Chloroflexota bacterium]
MERVSTTQLSSEIKRVTAGLGRLPAPVARPAFVVISGLPGTGKSYFASKLVERVPFAILESDAVRKSLFPSPSYSQEESSCVFRVLHLVIWELLKKGIPTIMDATNLVESEREHLYRIADRLEAKLLIVKVEAPPEVVYQRLEARQERWNPADKSDAGWEVYLRMKDKAEKITRKHYVVDTSRDITPALDKIVRELRRR